MAEYIFPKEILLRITTYNTKADLFLLKGTESPLLAPSPTPRLQENYETHCTKWSQRFLAALTFYDTVS